mmetsp:Transcript_104761/g.303188  ORF Transcript_104761/g.303188 Transcript_104761/m.303188 type:complete len:407 (-) Transcript_104761:406-1626(-)
MLFVSDEAFLGFVLLWLFLPTSSNVFVLETTFLSLGVGSAIAAPASLGGAASDSFTPSAASAASTFGGTSSTTWPSSGSAVLFSESGTLVLLRSVEARAGCCSELEVAVFFGAASFSSSSSATASGTSPPWSMAPLAIRRLTHAASPAAFASMRGVRPQASGAFTATSLCPAANMPTMSAQQWPGSLEGPPWGPPGRLLLGFTAWCSADIPESSRAPISESFLCIKYSTIALCPAAEAYISGVRPRASLQFAGMPTACPPLTPENRSNMLRRLRLALGREVDPSSASNALNASILPKTAFFITIAPCCLSLFCSLLLTESSCNSAPMSNVFVQAMLLIQPCISPAETRARRMLRLPNSKIFTLLPMPRSMLFALRKSSVALRVTGSCRQASSKPTSKSKLASITSS